MTPRTFIIFLLFSGFFSCSTVKYSKIKNNTLFKINNDSIKTGEFIYVYEKNNFNNENTYTVSDVDEYLDLFINFKLKVADAKLLGYDTTETFISEYETYKNQLLKPYLAETKEEERLMKEAYDRMHYEVNASHILIRVAPDATPQDTLTAYKKISEIAEKAKNGEDFNELAKQYSEDPSAKSNGGKLGYFSAFQMVFPFEEAAFTTPVGEISNIIHTRFGYHILKVHDKRPASGKVKVSHIMIRIGNNQLDSVAARNKAFEIYDELMNGADWNDLCRQYSDDVRTKENGGTLPFITINQINDAAFESTAFSLENPGDISDPVLSKFGWHIIKLEEKKGLEPYDEIKDDLAQKIHRDDRVTLSRKALIDKFKHQHHYTENETNLEALRSRADSSILEGKWSPSLSQEKLKATVFSLNNKNYSTEDLMSYIKNKQGKRFGISPSGYFDELLENYVESRLLNIEEKELASKNKELKMLLNEYYEGILLFDIMDKNVWTKAVKDTTGLLAYYNDNKEKYKWGERAKGAIVTFKNKDLAESVKNDLQKENYELLTTSIDVATSPDVKNLPVLDSIADLYEIYGQSTILITKYDSSEINKFSDNLLSFFSRQGINTNTVTIQNTDDKSNLIYISLNSTAKKSLELLYNKKSALTLQVLEGLFEKGDNEQIDKTSWEKGITQLEENGNYYLVDIEEILPPDYKDFNEIKGLIISDYQNYLEENWIKELKTKFSVEKDEKAFTKVKKYFSNKQPTDN